MRRPRRGHLRIPGRVLLAAVLLMHAGLSARAEQAATWAIDPLSAQPDLPPAGRSAFDLFIARHAGRPAFPFDALLAQLRTAAGVDALGRPGLKAVLIPAGRSLQRSAAAPHFFRFPRIVVAVDGEPAGSGTSAPRLKDRLYIGYQEKAGVLEVISYNEQAARFEFQIVKNYRAGATPQVFQARRAVCISCHQNHAPIFSRQQWDETNANPRIAARLASQGRSYFGISARQGIDQAYAIDNAAGRANLLAVWQRLWRDGCGTDDTAGLRCRAGAFLAMLQSRLADGPFDRSAPAYGAYRARIAVRWKTLWPDGLAVSNASVPNRDALPEDAMTGALVSAIPAAFEPLALRPPLERWSHARSEDVDRLVRGLGEFFSARDIRALDRTLFRAGLRAPRQTRIADCPAARRKAMPGGGFRLVLHCTSRAEDGQRLGLRAKLYFANAARIAGGSIDAMVVDHDDALPALAVGPSSVAAGMAQLSAHNAKGMSRSARGHHIETLSLDLTERPVRMRVRWREDFGLVQAAVAEMVATRSPALADGPIRRDMLLDALYAAMHVKAPRRSPPAATSQRVQLEQLPDARAASRDARAAGALDLTGFYRVCAACHDTPDAFPPNFLHGDERQVAAQMRQCAPRIRVRLHMWERGEGQRVRTPMPPPLGLGLLGVTSRDWIADDAYAALVREADRLDSGHHALPDSDDAYEALPACTGPMTAQMPGAPGQPGERRSHHAR